MKRWVVGQDPPPGAVRRGGQLTVQLRHPPAAEAAYGA